MRCFWKSRSEGSMTCSKGGVGGIDAHMSWTCSASACMPAPDADGDMAMPGKCAPLYGWGI